MRLMRLVLMLVLLVATGTMFAQSASAQGKQKAKADVAKADVVSASDLDVGVAILEGKRVHYQLTDAELYDSATDEGKMILGEMSARLNTTPRKVPAIINFNFYGLRDEYGRLTCSLQVLRPDFLGGPFTKIAASDSSRSPGTWDTTQPGDLVN